MHEQKKHVNLPNKTENGRKVYAFGGGKGRRILSRGGSRWLVGRLDVLLDLRAGSQLLEDLRGALAVAEGSMIVTWHFAGRPISAFRTLKKRGR